MCVEWMKIECRKYLSNQQREIDCDVDPEIAGGILYKLTLKYCRIFDWKKSSNDRDSWKKSREEAMALIGLQG